MTSSRKSLAPVVRGEQPSSWQKLGCLAYTDRMQPSAPQSPGNRSSARPTPGILIWTVLAALGVGLFAAMSLLALPAGTGPPAPFDVTAAPTPTPLPTPTQLAEDGPTPDLSAAGADLTPSPIASTPTPPAAAADPTALVGLWLSAVSAITALIGLASTLWLGWRKEGREMAQHRLELEKARLEIRKLEQELGATRNRPSSDAPVQ